MSRKRRPRIIPTYTDKVRRLVAVGLEHAEPGAVFVTPIAHDDGCPALETWSLRDCTCSPWFKQPVRIQTDEDLREYLGRRGRWAA
jgi:hypothetical protein